MESYDSSRCRRELADSYIGNGSRSCKYADSNVFAARKGGDSINDVVSSRYFENVRIHGRVRFPREEEGLFGLIFGTWRTTPGSSNDFNGSSIGTGAAKTRERRVGGGGRVIGVIGDRRLGLVREREVMRERLVLALVVVVVKFREHVVGVSIFGIYIFTFHDEIFFIFIVFNKWLFLYV